MWESNSASDRNLNSNEIDLDWEEWNPADLTFINHMIAGSFAGVAEHVMMFPVDTIKTHIQCERCGSSSPLKTWKCAKRIVDNEGILRLWRGVGATFSGCVPAHAAYFSIYESTKKILGVDQSGHYPMRAAFCGASAALAHDICMTPFDTVKQRIQLGYYKSVWHCTKLVVRTEGFGALFVSLPATLMMNVPYGMIMMAVNESAKEFLNPNKEFSLTTTMLSGSIAGATAAAFTTPLDIIKSRLQTQGLEPYVVSSSSGSIGAVPSSSSVFGFSGTSSLSRPSPGIVGRRNIAGFAGSQSSQFASYLWGSTASAAKEIFSEAGFMGYFRGAFPRVVVHAPAVGISWSAYELAKSFLADNNS